MAPAIRRDLCESLRVRRHRQCLQKKEKECTRRILHPGTAVVSKARAKEVRSQRDGVREKLESAAVHQARGLRSDRGFRGNKGNPPQECRTSGCRAKVSARKALVLDKEN